jgi:hypothetical protein
VIMSVVRSLLGLALLSLVGASGCAIQTGDPSVDETNKPAETSESAARPANDPAAENGESLADPSAPRPALLPGRDHFDTGGSGDQPQPSPWSKPPAHTPNIGAGSGTIVLPGQIH